MIRVPLCHCPATAVCKPDAGLFDGDADGGYGDLKATSWPMLGRTVIWCMLKRKGQCNIFPDEVPEWVF
jgi:hypothetical protein